MAIPEIDAAVSPARRRFLGLAATAVGRVALGAVLGGTVLSASAEAKKPDDAGKKAPKVFKGRKPSKSKGKPLCFLQGTRISTPEGEVAIEELRIGDLVQTVSGAAKPIKWIGRSSYKKSGGSWQARVTPIRISRGALGAQAPSHDLFLSPSHALLVDGHLVPANELVNGTTIAPEVPSGTEVVRYFQILLDTHEGIFAEGTPAETLLIENGTECERFSNYERLYGHASPALMTPFAPFMYYWGGRSHLHALLRRDVPFRARARSSGPGVCQIKARLKSLVDA